MYEEIKRRIIEIEAEFGQEVVEEVALTLFKQRQAEAYESARPVCSVCQRKFDHPRAGGMVLVSELMPDAAYDGHPGGKVCQSCWQQIWGIGGGYFHKDGSHIETPPAYPDPSDGVHIVRLDKEFLLSTSTTG